MVGAEDRSVPLLGERRGQRILIHHAEIVPGLVQLPRGVESSPAEGAVLELPGTTSHLGEVGAEDVVGLRPGGAVALLWQVFAVEGRQVPASEAQRLAQGRLICRAIGHASRRDGVPASPVGMSTQIAGELREVARRRLPLAAVPCRKCLQTVRPGDRPAHVAHNAGHEGPHLGGAPLRLYLLVATLRDGDLRRIVEAQLVPVKAFAPVSVDQSLHDGCSGLVGVRVRNAAVEAPSGVVPPKCAELGDGHVTKAQHAEGQLGAPLPVCLLELEIRNAQEHVGTAGGQLHDRGQILGLRRHGRVVLADEERLLELLLVVRQELVAYHKGRAGGVEALDKPLTVGGGQVILGRVPNSGRVQHRCAQGVHLAEGGQGVEPRAP
mmetsp:Transcript_87611/g.274413  ORF Transcript_87611/g.274413 Transcript_87611/m.274413 type:complete len:380 (+) Transcript_87611:282-1421(+)